MYIINTYSLFIHFQHEPNRPRESSLWAQLYSISRPKSPINQIPNGPKKIAASKPIIIVALIHFPFGNSSIFWASKQLQPNPLTSPSPSLSDLARAERPPTVSAMFRRASSLLARPLRSARARSFSTDLPAASSPDEAFVETWKKMIPNIDPPKTPLSFMAPRPATPSSIPTKLTVNFVLPYASELSSKEVSVGNSLSSWFFFSFFGRGVESCAWVFCIWFDFMWIF